MHKLCEDEFVFLGDGLEYVIVESRPPIRSKGTPYRIGTIGHRTDAESNSELIRRLEEIRSRYERDGGKDKQTDEDNTIDEGKYEEEQIEEEKLVFSKALAYCISKKEVTVSEIRAEISCGYIRASYIAEWLVKNRYAVCIRRGSKTYYRAVISKEVYVEKFGRNFADFYWDVDKDGVELLKKLSKRLQLGGNRWRGAFDKPEKKLPKSYYAMFSPSFNMAKTVADMPDLTRRIDEVISRAQHEVAVFGREWDSSKNFEGLCMDVLENIICTDRHWLRMDAVKEAASRMAAVEYAGQGNAACSLHSRVLYELLDGTDEDYERVKWLIWRS